MRVFLVLPLPLHHRSHGPSGDEPVCVAGVNYQIAGVWNAGVLIGFMTWLATSKTPLLPRFMLVLNLAEVEVGQDNRLSILLRSENGKRELTRPL
jgi:hypothetical protein